MYYIDTATDSVDALDFDMETGAVSNSARIDTSAVTGSPDGCCIGSNGHLWMAMWDGSASHFDPASGALLETGRSHVTGDSVRLWRRPILIPALHHDSALRLSEPEPLPAASFAWIFSRGVTGAHSMGGSFIKDSRAVLL